MQVHAAPGRRHDTPPPGRRHRAAGVLTLAAALAGAVLIPAGTASASPARPAPAPPVTTQPDLGPNVVVFDPGMKTADIQAKVDAIAHQQVGNQFGTERYSLLFKPGTYGTPEQPLVVEVGYYTEVAGLGQSPEDVVINGHVDVYNQCYPTAPGAPTDCTALNNFWRSLSNLTVNIAGGDGCHAGPDFWAASQAAPMRRVNMTGGNVFLFDYCSSPNYASGGFIADSAFSGGAVVNGGQQQYYTRNSDLDSWTNGVWNQVFSGDDNAPAQSFGQEGGQPYTTLAATPVSREKPYLYVDAKGGWNVFVPSAQRDSVGTSWQDGQTPGRSIPLRDFYVAKPGDSAARINAALLTGKNLLVTPGVYDVASSLYVLRPNTVVLGMGIATMTATRGNVALTVGDVPGVDIAGLTFDAGSVNSPALLRVGTKALRGWHLPGKEPTALQDVFFRIGGPHVGKASVSLEVNSDDVLLDDIWAWRADHGEGVGWTVNTADTGVVVNGDDVTATGLFVEHYQKYNVIWNGERGRTVFFQNELPYDAPDQAAWQHDGVQGWAAYKVADTVRTHEAWGLGSYIYTNVNPTLHATNAFEVPRRPGVRMHDLITVSLNKAGTIDHVINGVGAAVTPDRQGPEQVVSYP